MSQNKHVHQTSSNIPGSDRINRKILLIVLGLIGGVCLLCSVSWWSILPHWRSAQILLTFNTDRGHDVGQMYTPSYIGVDGQGTIYVGDWDDGRVSVFDSTGKYLRVIDIGKGTVLLGMAVAQDGTLYFSYDGSIHRMDPQGNQSTLSYVDARGDTIANISGIALEPDGSLAAADNFGDVLQISADGRPQVVLAKAFDLPSFSSRNELDPSGPPILSYDVPANSADKNISVAADSSGNIYAVGWISADVLKTDPNGGSLSKFGGFANFPGGFERNRFYFPDGIAVDSSERIYVADSNGVEVFSAQEQYLYSIHLPDGAQTLALDNDGNIYVLTTPYDHQLGSLVYKVVKFAPLEP